MSTGMNGEDVSCIYPLESTDCYYPYSPKDPVKDSIVEQQIISDVFRKEDIKGDVALNDLLDRLNKSQSTSVVIDLSVTGFMPQL